MRALHGRLEVQSGPLKTQLPRTALTAHAGPASKPHSMLGLAIATSKKWIGELQILCALKIY